MLFLKLTSFTSGIGSYLQWTSISFMWQEYKTALRYTNRLLQIEPNNRQAIELQEKINDQMKKGQLASLEQPQRCHDHDWGHYWLQLGNRFFLENCKCQTCSINKAFLASLQTLNVKCQETKVGGKDISQASQILVFFLCVISITVVLTRLLEQKHRETKQFESVRGFSYRCRLQNSICLPNN